MVYLIIKELSPSADEVVIIVTSSLMKDMNSKTDMYRANAIHRTISETSNSGQESQWLLVQSLVSGNSCYSRWSNVVQEAAKSRAALVQFHALALHQQGNCFAHTLAQCLLNSLCYSGLFESQLTHKQGTVPIYDFLESCLRHKAEMVILESCQSKYKSSVLRSLFSQLFLSSSKPVLRFAAFRTLNKVAMTHPMAVTNCNIDMESLISDQNRSIATLAITTLLKNRK
ncbi:hypothetical protein NC651_023311 [Populus alba x Populus x berolinensis]|nr:hypothetical protein NC651_023311 [Populus alba x Populus x berolinensis]